MTFSNRVYDIVKFLAQLFFPGAATFYAALTPIWNLPYSTQVVASVVALDTFLGGLLYVSSAGYTPPTDGRLIIDQSVPSQSVMHLDFDDARKVINQKPRTVTLAIKGPSSDPISAQVQ